MNRFKSRVVGVECERIEAAAAQYFCLGSSLNLFTACVRVCMALKNCFRSLLRPHSQNQDDVSMTRLDVVSLSASVLFAAAVVVAAFSLHKSHNEERKTDGIRKGRVKESESEGERASE